MNLAPPGGKGALAQREGNFFALPGLQFNLFESLQFPHGAYRVHIAFHVAHVQLHRRLAGPRARVFHGDRRRHGVRVLDLVRAQLQAAVFERRVAQSVAEGEQHVHLLFVVVPVAHEDAFPVFRSRGFSAVEQIAGVVFQLDRESFRQVSGGIHVAEQHFHFGQAHRLSAQIGFQHALHLADPGHFHRGSVVQHHHGVRVRFRHRFDQFVLAFRHPHVRPVVAFAFIGIRQSGKHHGHLRLLRRRRRFRDHVRGRVVRRHVIAPGIGHLQAFRRFHRAGGLEAVDVAAAAALEPGLLGKLADKGDVVFLVQGQDAALVLQQHHAVRRHFGRLQVLRFHVPGRFRLRVFHIAENDVQYPLAAKVHQLLVQLPGLHRFHDLLVVDAAAGRHFQIQSRRHAGHPVAHRAPVGHHVALESPFLPQHVRQQPGVLRGKGAVDPVVGAHHGPGLSLLHGHFKGREVNLADGSLVALRRAAHPPVFLVVQGKVLDARAHVFALDALDQRRGHHARQVRVFREVFEVPAAQGAALDVHRRSQQHAQLFMLACVAQCFAHLFDHVGIEGRRRGAGRGETDCFDAVVDAQVVRLLVLLAQSVGAVAHHALRYAEAFHALGVPEVLAGKQSGFFFQRHLCNQFSDFVEFHMSPQRFCLGIL